MTYAEITEFRNSIELTIPEFEKFLGIGKDTYRQWGKSRGNIPKALVYRIEELKLLSKKSLAQLKSEREI